VNEVGASILAQSPFLARLAWLSLDHTQCGIRGLLELLRSKNLGFLHRLNVSRALLPPSGELDDLTADQVRVPLTTLNMAGVELARWGLRGVYALLESLKVLKLDLARNQLGPANCPWLTDCVGLRDVIHLGLAGNNLRGLEALTRSQVLKNLVSLDLSGVPLGDEEGLALSQCTQWRERIRLIASPLGLSRQVLERLYQRYERLDAHQINVPRWVKSEGTGE
jgi:hypothetical protein